MKRAIVFSGNLQNVGDLALLLQTAYGIRENLKIDEIFVRQWSPVHEDVVRQLNDHRIGVLQGKDLLACLKLLPGALLLFGGGQMVRDNASLASISTAAFMMRLARLFGGRCAAIGCGASRLKKKSHRLVWKFITSQLVLFAARDRNSADVIAGFGTQENLVVTADLIHSPSPLKTALIGERSDTILVAPCEDFSEGRTISASLVSDVVIQHCLNTGSRDAVVACHDSRPGMDLGVAEVISNELISKAVPATIHQGYVLQEFIQLYRDASLVVTNRLHAVFFAAIAGKAIILIDDGNPKTKAAAQQLRIPLLGAGADNVAVAKALEIANDTSLLSARALILDTVSDSARSNFTLLSESL